MGAAGGLLPDRSGRRALEESRGVCVLRGGRGAEGPGAPARERMRQWRKEPARGQPGGCSSNGRGFFRAAFARQAALWVPWRPVRAALREAGSGRGQGRS